MTRLQTYLLLEAVLRTGRDHLPEDLCNCIGKMMITDEYIKITDFPRMQHATERLLATKKAILELADHPDIFGEKYTTRYKKFKQAETSL